MPHAHRPLLLPPQLWHRALMGSRMSAPGAGGVTLAHKMGQDFAFKLASELEMASYRPRGPGVSTANRKSQELKAATVRGPGRIIRVSARSMTSIHWQVRIGISAPHGRRPRGPTGGATGAPS
jgi:hypothetical protein